MPSKKTVQKPGILIDATSLTAPLTGIGKYTHEICKRLVKINDLDLTFYYGYYSKNFNDNQNRDTLFNSVIETRKKLANFPILKKIARKGLMLYSRFGNSHHEIYWEPNIVPLPALQKRADKCVATIHDFSWYYHPEWHPRERLDFFRKHFWAGIRNCSHLICGSEYTKNEIMEITGFPESRISVIYHGVDHKIFKKYPLTVCESYSKKIGLPKKFILFVGTLEPRKNLERLLAAYSILPEKIKNEYRLVIAGGRGWNDKTLRKTLAGMKKHVHLTGYVPENRLPLLYNLASLFVYPSLYEGFGIPPLEAMACGCPVIVSDTTAMPEICGNAALYCDPQDPEDMSHNIQKILEDHPLAETLKNRGIEKANRYSWDISAENHSNIFKKAGKDF